MRRPAPVAPHGCDSHSPLLRAQLAIIQSPSSHSHPQMSSIFAPVPLDGISRVFTLDVPRNDFYRVFSKAGVLPRLAGLMLRLQSALCAGEGIDRVRQLQKVADLLLLFSGGDDVVKVALSRSDSLAPVLELLGNKESRVPNGRSSSAAWRSCDQRTILEGKLLKVVKNVVMEVS